MLFRSILAVRSLQANLLEDFAVQVGVEAPDMFLIDIQDDQRARVAAFVDGANGTAPAPTVIPVLRARVVGVRGRDVSLESYEDVRGRGSLSREYTITYRSTLNDNERLLEGQWWGTAPSTGSAGEVSIEERDRKSTRLNSSH